MVKITNAIIGLLNLITFLISLLFISIGLWFRSHGVTQCEKLFHLPILIVGACLLVVSTLGLVGSCCRVSFFLWTYLLILFFVIIAMAAFSVFTFVVTRNGVARNVVSGINEVEDQLRLDGYSHWLQKKVADSKTWQEIEGCLKTGKVCGRLQTIQVFMDSLNKTDEVYIRRFALVKSGCCKPPTYCGYENHNATYWTVPSVGLRSTEVDCTAWSNDHEQLCYACNSCKAGVLATVKAGWRDFAIVSVCLDVFLLVVYMFGCCALRNNMSSSRYSRYYGS